MANRYPPTPSFGGVFPSLPYLSLPSQQNGQYLFSGRPQVTSPMSAPQPAPAGNPQALNASHYAVNAQIPSPGPVMPPIPPHPFSQELFKQLVNSSLPPPPPPSFPPVPIPNLDFSAYQPPPTLQNNFTPPQNHSPDNVIDNSGNPLHCQKGPQPAFEKASEPIIVSREEGELSDGELEEHSAAESSRTIPREEAVQVQISRNKDYSALETQHHSNPSARSPPIPPLKSGSTGQKATDFARSHHTSQNHPKYNADIGNVLQDEHKGIPEITPLSPEDSGSSYDPPSVTTPDSALDRSNARNGASPKAHGKNPSQMRELAKGALLSLAPHGIRYPDLVREGVDPNLLHQLYEEIGIKDSRPELQAGSSTYQIQTSEQKAFSVSEPHTNTRSIFLPAKPPSSLSTTPVAANFKEASNPQQSVSQSKFDSNGLPRETETPPKTKPAPSLSINSPVVTAATNVAMERKDRIAQLLAAKTGKPAPMRNAPDPANLPIQLTSSPDPAPQVHPRLTTAEHTIAPNLANQPVPKPIKNKAQTELVRQKMESLKKEAEAKARAQTQSQASIPPRPDMPVSDPNTTQVAPTAQQSLSTNLNQQDVAHPDGSSATSNILPVNKPSPQLDYAYRIPGLFMTSDEPSHTEEQVCTTSQGQARMSSDREHALEQESRTSSAQDHSSVPGSLTEFNLASLGNKGSTSRLTQKRPLASDSFDDPTPPTKRPFGRKDSVEHIEIDVSEGESDDGSDGIGMDIDEDSQASGLLSSATPNKEASEQDTQTSLPTTKQPERPSIQRQTTNSSFGVSTPTKEKDKEDLWRAKNAEIEAMRKKIAEMEQRRKTKQGQSQAQSPQASLPGTPAPPKVQAASPTQASPNPVSILPTHGSSRNQTHGNVHTAIQAATDGDHQSLAIDQLSRMATESPSHNEDLRKKMARRKELQSGLPNLDAEVQATQLKLAQTKARLAVIKREAEKREAEIREARQREAEILAEAMRLEEQLNVGLTGRSRFSEELQSLGGNLEAVPEARKTFAESLEPDRNPSNSDYAQSSADLTGQPETQDIPDVGPAAGSGSMADAYRKSPTVDESIHETKNDAAEEGHTVIPDSSNEKFPYDAGINAPARTSVLIGRNFKELNDNSRSQSQITADLESYRSSIVPRSSDEQSADEENVVEDPSANLNDVAAGLEYDNDGSVSMSDSGTDDYEPAEVPDATQYSDKDSVGYEPDDGILQGDTNQEEPSDIDDDYEPAEEVEPMEVDLRTIQHVSMNNYQRTESRQPEPADERSSDPYSPEPLDKSASSDIEDGLELSEANMLTIPQDFSLQADVNAENDDVLPSDEAVATHFTAYESPLLFSKNFRFDPSFTALVAGGYNSLTYSNKIDPSRPLCPTEAEGGTCTDPECEEQHFQQMALPDDKILVEMSSARDFKLGDQHDQFVIGLKQVIAELRSKGVREFPTVAGALAAYRRTFAESIDPNRAMPFVHGKSMGVMNKLHNEMEFSVTASVSWKACSSNEFVERASADITGEVDNLGLRHVIAR